MIVIWPLIAYGAAVLTVAAGMLSLSAVSGKLHREGAKDDTFEIQAGKR